MTPSTKRTGAKRNPHPLALSRPQLPRVRIGIEGLDEITRGGLPKGRPTLVCGNAGCGKTMLAMEFLVRGAKQFGEPGVMMSFAESVEDLTANVASLGFDLKGLIASKLIAVDFLELDRHAVQVAGDYDLEPLFIRMEAAIRSVGAKRLVLDSREALFASVRDTSVLRSELQRLFRWLKDHAVTAIITGEAGVNTLTRHGLEEYISDCVIVLDNRIEDQVASRRLRVVKYRGSLHGGDEYPFLIDQDGMSLIPITSAGLTYPSPGGRISSGIAGLDEMLGGKGFFRGSSVLVSGTSGTGKTSFLAQFANASCARGERVCFFAFEESPSQILRNMRSIGVDLEPWIAKGLLRIEARRPSQFGLDMHLIMIQKSILEFKPHAVLLDPVTSFSDIRNMSAVKRTLMKLVDFLKNHEITSMFSSLNPSSGPQEGSAVAISSLIDAWILLRDLESDKERVRGLYVLKARGMAHSNQVREFLLSNKGVTLCDVYVGAGGSVVTGTARMRGIAEDLALAGRLHDESEMRQIGLEKKRAELETDIAAMRATHAAEAAAVWASFAGTVTKPRQGENQSSSARSGRTVKTKTPPAKGAR